MWAGEANPAVLDNNHVNQPEQYHHDGGGKGATTRGRQTLTEKRE